MTYIWPPVRNAGWLLLKTEPHAKLSAIWQMALRASRDRSLTCLQIARIKLVRPDRRGHQASHCRGKAGRYRQELRCRYQHDPAADLTALLGGLARHAALPQENANCLSVLRVLIFCPGASFIGTPLGPRATLIGMLLSSVGLALVSPPAEDRNHPSEIPPAASNPPAKMNGSVPVRPAFLSL